jgi:hypothetical protein
MLNLKTVLDTTLKRKQAAAVLDEKETLEKYFKLDESK